MRIAGNSFVVTGGASGLGLACARHLAGAGAKLAIIDIDAMAAERAAAEIGAGAIALGADIADEGEARAALEGAESRIGPVRGLINCAGVAPGERVVGRNKVHALESFERAIRINLVGTFNMTRLGALLMSAHEPLETGERGIIVNTASIAAFDGQVGQAAYAASKGGVASMTLPIARELGGQGIRVMCIAPGVFRTPMMDKMPDEVKSKLGALAPFPPRMGEPAEFASLVAHVIENTYLNGEIIRLDGAIRMPAR